MNDSCAVDVGQSVQQRTRQRVDVELLAARLGERPARDVLHDEQRPLRLDGEVEDLHEVRVVEPGRQPSLALEAGDKAGIAGENVGDDLDRDLTLELEVHRPPDDGHAAAADDRLEAVAAVAYGGPWAERAQSPSLPWPLPCCSFS